MRKWILGILCCCLTLSLCACGNNSEVNTGERDTSSSAEVADNDSSLYAAAAELESKQDYAGAAIAFGKIIEYSDARERSIQNWEKTIKHDTISCSTNHTVALKNDGTVIATGLNQKGQCDLSEWNNIISVSAGPALTVGLTANHTVVSTADINLSEWRDIVDVKAGSRCIIGLVADGTIVYAELYEGADGIFSDTYTASRLVDVVAIDADVESEIFMALTLDGEVVCASTDNRYGQCKVGSWGSNIINIDAGKTVTVGLKQNGHVEYAGFEGSQSDAAATIIGNSIKGWSDIMCVVAGNDHIVCLKSDGTLDAVCFEEIAREISGSTYPRTETDVHDWSDIVDVIACGHLTVGLRSDGTVIATGDNDKGACDVSDWSDIRVPTQ